ncbi:ABC transporter ATP-binding protein [Vibrio sp. HN007]|uniref:ABC transporter ATP-binding protein n=1 Tax=Vibrio iocasae TaxID=3098914 RepID=UPI0035D4AC74
MTIEFSDFSFQYDSLDKPTLSNINLQIKKGEKVVIVGPSGSGKSTLGQCLNGLIPHARKGKISGSLTIDGHDALKFAMNDYTEKVGTVLQDADNQFVGLSIGEDIAFALENQLVKSIDMYPIVKATAGMVDLEGMLDHSPHELSGGQKQRVSLAGILVDDVDVLLFDEPLAALDPKTSQKTIDIIDKLHSESGKTVIIIEHRLEDVLYRNVDRVVLIDKGTIVADMTPDEILASTLLKKHGIREPLYLSALKVAGCKIEVEKSPSKLSDMPITDYKERVNCWFEKKPSPIELEKKDPLLSIEALSYSYDGDAKALSDIGFNVHKGEVISVLGKNGSGKSTLTKLIMGVINPDSGAIKIGGEDLSELSIFERSQKVGVVMQNPNHMISHHMIFDEIAFGLRNRGVDESTVTEKVGHILELCGLKKYRNWPIDALSYGQKKRVTIASILVLEPEILILDEPTAGQDYLNYTSMMRFVQKLNRELGITVIIISHDMHLVLEYTTRSIVISDSFLIADAPMTEVFSQPDLLDKANLATTSLYQLAIDMGIQDTNTFMQHFIEQERAA